MTLDKVSERAVRCIKVLHDRGFKAYLVGGCIRDLLLNKNPKDFDVSTNATPEQVHKIFSNSRIIGRRFKIVHVVYGNEIIEVTTFRSNADAKSASKGVPLKKGNTRVSDQSGMLLRDNVYGKKISDDALRRDFTINALYLDPEEGMLYDYLGGLYDLTQEKIDIIGDPEVRYSEDPVRMIRALRFSAKLGFKISKRTSDPIKRLSDNLLDVSNARMFEEVNKLFLTGHGYESFQLLRRYHIFEKLFPSTAGFLDNKAYTDFVEYALKSSDERYHDGRRNMPHFLYSVILWSSFKENYFKLSLENDCNVQPSTIYKLINIAKNNILVGQNTITDIPMAVENNISSLWSLQILLDQIDDESIVNEVTTRHIFRAAFDFLKLRSRFNPYLRSVVEFYEPYYLKSRAEAEARKAQNDERRISREKRLEEKRSLKKAKKNRKKKASEETFDDTKNYSAERLEQLRKAREWRKAMNLEF
ncbi:MAG: polynucleotide adenylyltransferase PcnB [Succinivibrio sp.]